MSNESNPQSAQRTNRLNISSIYTHLQKPLYRNSYALLVNLGTTSGLGIVFWWLSAHLYGVEFVGLNSGAISAVTFLCGIAMLDMQGTLTRYVPQMGSNTGRFISLSYLAIIVMGGILAVIFLAGLPVWAPALGFITATPVTTIWFILSIMVTSISAVQDSVLSGLRQSMWVPVDNGLYGLIKIVLLVAFAVPLGKYGIFIAYTISMIPTVLLINLLIFTRLIPKHIEQTRDKRVSITFREIIKFIGSNYINSLLSSMSTALLPIIIINVAGATENAYFYLAWLFAGALQLIGSTMTTSLQVEIVHDRSKIAVYSRRIMVTMLGVTTPLALVIIIGGPLLLGFFGHVYAEEGVLLLRLLALSAFPNLVNYTYLSIARAENNAVGIIVLQVALSIPLLVGGYILLKLVGISGIGWAFLLSQSAVALFLLVTKMRFLIWAPKPSDSASPSDES